MGRIVLAAAMFLAMCAITVSAFAAQPDSGAMTAAHATASSILSVRL
jgi:hypothetical protein